MCTGSTETTFRRLAPRVSEGEALAHFSKRRGLTFRRPQPVRLEVVYVPVYLLAARISDSRDGKQREVLVAVDAIAGNVRRLDHRVELSRSSPPPPGDLFAPAVPLEDALARAAEEVPWLVLPVALKHNRRFPVDQLSLVDRLGYPYWVQHLRRGRYRDFRALDGSSGTLVGAAGRAVLLKAFVS